MWSGKENAIGECMKMSVRTKGWGRKADKPAVKNESKAADLNSILTCELEEQPADPDPDPEEKVLD